jgi:hypothetical protein
MESILHKRYKLGERLFSNALGELFLGRDLQASNHHVLLIHYLPKQLSDQALKQSLAILQKMGAEANAPVLKVLDCAWSDTEVFFVLETPTAWSLTPLPPIQGQPTKLHQKAYELTQQLIDQNLISKGLEPSLFMVTPNGDLSLLGTAFLSELQELQAQLPSLLQAQALAPKPKKRHFLALGLLAASGLVAAASLGVYQFTKTDSLANPIVPQRTVSEWDKPKLSLEEHTELPSEAASASTRVVPLALKTQSQEAASALITSPPANDKAASMSTAATPANNLVVTSPSSNPQAKQNLNKANEAIKNGHLQTGLYYLRLAKKLNPSEAELQHTAESLLEHAQQTLSTELSTQMQESIEQEFNLQE